MRAEPTLRHEVRTLRVAIQALDATLQRLISRNGTRTARSDRRRPKVRLSPSARAALVLQGRYMGFMRQLKPRQKAFVRAIKQKRGVRAAITTARRLSFEA